MRDVLTTFFITPLVRFIFSFYSLADDTCHFLSVSLFLCTSLFISLCLFLSLSVYLTLLSISPFISLSNFFFFLLMLLFSSHASSFFSCFFFLLMLLFSGQNGPQRLLEGKNINQSLHALNNVFLSLTDPKCSFVNFRGSKLTQCLQVSLSGNSNISIICCITPSKL